VISSKDREKESGPKLDETEDADRQEPFEPVDEIQEPFAQFTSLGARRISD
jgi:hypothetical protein